ncbi:HpcH/HpaI aldolase/citrate lyase family protein [Sulfurimonas sp.]|jgi:citrate lyase beta subunit|uniref:HpcH/HpaI aldolase/citrate lyase family protein n=1 Tax=Sulfurimonas sp. TaxID=2022749 RepID=UPI0025F153D3|nr:HpcH/HpaI aldolase/citrate lyase family protein [Sulfurimonas sp.]MBT5935349.1 HpcH/HpaI aldolase/citrate lyase family protein [Sulfurimonas sp.]
MNEKNYIALGGTLFVPSTHKNLENIICHEKYVNLKSVLVDTEDGLNEVELSIGLKAIEKLLKVYKKKKLLVFIRPKNTNILKKLLSMSGIEKIDGFILPKFSLTNAKEYLDILKPYDFGLMPSIEGKELFNQNELHELKDILLTSKQNIVLVRFGLEDMLRQLSMKRSCEESLFDYAATASVIGNFIAVFKSAGFVVSGGVYPCFKDEDGFIRDVKRDLKEGLFSKTIIHPNQIKIVNDLYKVSREEYDEAKKICESQNTVFNLNDKMAEKLTMEPYSNIILIRAEIYGVADKLIRYITVHS